VAEPESFALRIERSMAGLTRMGDWVDRIAAALRLDTRTEYALRLCLEEAASNVVVHGAPDEAEAGFVGLSLVPEPEALRVIVEDRCSAFDPLKVPAAQIPTGLEDARVGGLGIHLMRQYAQAIEYERRDGTNRLMLRIPRIQPLSREAGSSREADRQG
jgi:anti-sigma regulatory factor (Ser/Thr protein kinase)